MAAVLFAVFNRNPMFAAHKKYEDYGVWVSVLSLGVEYFVSVITPGLYLSSDPLFDLDHCLVS